MEKDRKKQIIVKAVCVIASFCLWLYITNYENPIQTYRIKNVSVKILNQDYLKQNNLVLSPNQSFYVTLTVKGNASELFSLRADDFKLTSDVSAYALKKGVNRIPVKVDRSPDNINIVQTDSLWIDINLDEYSQKTVPVKANIEGKPQTGLYSYEPSLNPRNVTVSGPSKEVELVNHVEVNVNVSNLSSDAMLKVVPKPVDGRGNLVSDVKVQPEAIEVGVPIKKAKSVKINVKTSGQPGAGITIKSIDPEQDYVDVIGSKAALSEIESIDTENIDLSSITGDTEVKVKLIAPKNIQFAGSSGTITVKIVTEVQQPKSTQTQNVSVNIDPLNLGSGLNAKLDKTSVNLGVSGNNINTGDIKASVDLSNLGEGTYSLPIKLTIPGSVTKQSQDITNVNVTITKK